MTDSSTRDRAEGMFDQGKGNAKQGVGDLTDNERMKGEGELDELKGKGEQAWGDIKDAAGDLMDDLEMEDVANAAQRLEDRCRARRGRCPGALLCPSIALVPNAPYW